MLGARIPTQLAASFKVGEAVPQTAVIPVVTRRFSSELLNSAAYSPEDSKRDRKCHSARLQRTVTKGLFQYGTNASLFEGQGECVGLVRRGVRWATALGCWRARFPAPGIVGSRAAGSRTPAGAAARLGSAWSRTSRGTARPRHCGPSRAGRADPQLPLRGPARGQPDRRALRHADEKSTTPWPGA